MGLSMCVCACVEVEGGQEGEEMKPWQLQQSRIVSPFPPQLWPGYSSVCQGDKQVDGAGIRQGIRQGGKLEDRELGKQAKGSGPGYGMANSSGVSVSPWPCFWMVQLQKGECSATIPFSGGESGQGRC